MLFSLFSDISKLGKYTKCLLAGSPGSSWNSDGLWGGGPQTIARWSCGYEGAV